MPRGKRIWLVHLVGCESSSISQTCKSRSGQNCGRAFVLPVGPIEIEAKSQEAQLSSISNYFIPFPDILCMFPTRFSFRSSQRSLRTQEELRHVLRESPKALNRPAAAYEDSLATAPEVQQSTALGRLGLFINYICKKSK